VMAGTAWVPPGTEMVLPPAAARLSATRQGQGMDKAQFIAIAPIYYAIAIVHYFRETDAREARSTEIERRFNEFEHPDETPSLPFRPFFEKAVAFLLDRGIIEAYNDLVAPQVLFLNGGFTSKLNNLTSDTRSPFRAYGRLVDPLPWLFEALDRTESIRQELGVEAADLEDSDEWAPLELDRSEPELTAVIEAVDDTIEAVRGDNGYAQAMPQERSFVLDSLSAFLKTIKEAPATSMPYVKRFAIEPLSRLAKTFARTAWELTISAAKEAIKGWLKKHGQDWIEYFF
jgi:hypothetical protein